MHYEGHVIRPPSEADSILLQVTVGCSHNRCAFCGTYREVRYHGVDPVTVSADLAEAARRYRDIRRIFLCDGDAIALPMERLREILGGIRSSLPWTRRVGMYASATALRDKTDADLSELKSLGVGIAYLGLESGDDTTLMAQNKGADAAEIIAAGRRLKAVGIKLNVTVIVGLAGPERSLEHARATGAALSAMEPDQIGALSLMLVPGSPLWEAERCGGFIVPNAAGMLRELRTLLEATELKKTLFFANHASNYLPLQVRLPREKDAALAAIDAALAGAIPLRPEAWRGL